jgi:phosphonate transport system substrate-binding protein
MAHPDSKPEAGNVLRVAVAAMISPKETFIYYRELLDYIGAKSGHGVQLIQRRTYEEVNALFPKGEIDLAFICTGPYAASREKFGFEALATPQVRGQPFYQSYLIVPKEAPSKDLKDLKGRVFAFTDPDSNTGAMVPRFGWRSWAKHRNLFSARRSSPTATTTRSWRWPRAWSMRRPWTATSGNISSASTPATHPRPA